MIIKLILFWYNENNYIDRHTFKVLENNTILIIFSLITCKCVYYPHGLNK